MEKTNINPAILQEFLDSAPNARDKGQSQFFTPIDFAQQLAASLPQHRPVIVDLNCGNGQLLQGSANASTRFLLGCDIDPGRVKPEVRGQKSEVSHLPVQKITRDLTLLCTRLHEVDWRGDLFVANPPWSLYWWKDRLAALEQSKVSAVADAFRQRDPHALRPGGRDTLEASVATLMLCLDRCTAYGEGLLIANNNTLERKIFGPDAPHRALARHVWARLIVPGNPMTGLDHANFEREQAENGEKEFATGIIYFAREHTSGPATVINWADSGRAQAPDRSHRQGAELRGYQSWAYAGRKDDVPESVELWTTVKQQAQVDADASRNKHQWNLWLTVGGLIQTHLSLFEKASVKVDKNKAARLHKLHGKRPMQLVMQRADRDELLQIAEQDGWKVAPDLLTAVKEAINEYHKARAPLYPLPEIQRLGYCDEVDFLECKLDLNYAARTSAHCADDKCRHEVIDWAGEKPPMNTNGHEAKVVAVPCKKCGKPLAFTEHPVPEGIKGVLFRAGKSYALRTKTEKITRVVWKPNAMTGAPELLEYDGQELAMYITAEDGWEYCFMDGKLRGRACKIPTGKVLHREDKKKESHPSATRAIDFPLQELPRAFVIPEVPDVAQCNPTGYQEKLQLVEELETLTTELTLQAA